MKMRSILMAGSLVSVTLFPALAQAEADWKRGRVYYRMVCTQCHAEKAGGAISPSVKTKAEWATYFQADKHAKGKDTVKFYFSSKFRDSIKATNKAAAKFADVPEADLAEDVKEFLQKGAKDGDAPARCS